MIHKLRGFFRSSPVERFVALVKPMEAELLQVALDLLDGRAVRGSRAVLKHLVHHRR